MSIFESFKEIFPAKPPTRLDRDPPTEVDGPETVEMLEVKHPDGRLSQYPPKETWHNWREWDSRYWPNKKARAYQLIPTICFNCESACGLLAYVDKATFKVKKFEGNPLHPGSRGRNCAKGPATINQIDDPERILYPLKRVGARGEGRWKRISWEEALGEIAAKMGQSLDRRKDGIMYHVGRPGEDHYTNRCIKAWGVDAHNSHTNICSAGARAGYSFWAGFDRPSPDYENAKTILLISSHLETGHYFNPHAQRIIEAQANGAKIVTFDPRLSNTASKSDVWLPCWPGSEATILLAIANFLLQNDLYDRQFLRDWVNWKEFLMFLRGRKDEWLRDQGFGSARLLLAHEQDMEEFSNFEKILKATYGEFTFERAAKESRVPIERIEQAAAAVAHCEGRLAAHTWRSASIGNLGGWQVARCLFFLNVLTGSVGKKGGTFGNSWNKFTPKPFKEPPAFSGWNELQMPEDWPLAFYEMSFLLPHFLDEDRGDIDVYFTRVYNPMWINPDGFSWLRALVSEDKIKCHVALTPTWNESAWFADYVLPMGHASERHDLMSQETHNGKWIGFRQPVRRVALEQAGKEIRFTYEANPGEVWEEAEFWVELSGKLDPDGKRGIRQWFESPNRPGELISQDEYWGWIFEHSVPGLPEAAAKEGLTPLAYMKAYGCFEISKDEPPPFMDEVETDGVPIRGKNYRGFATPSKRLELFSKTLYSWGWSNKEYFLPWPLKSHVHPDNIDAGKGEMLLLPNFRLPTLVHTRSANCKWLYEISHKNPVWINPEDASRIGLKEGGLVRVTTEIGYFVDEAYITEAIMPGIIAMSHHLGRWRLKEDQGVNAFASTPAKITQDGANYRLNITGKVGPYESPDPDTQRIWWSSVGVHQNLTHGVHPDPVSGAHCWLQKAHKVEVAKDGDLLGDVWVDQTASKRIYEEWKAMTRGAKAHSPDGTRRPLWLKRPLRPTDDSFRLPE